LRKWEQNELELGAAVARGENSGTVNTETFNGYLQYNRLISEKAYGMLRTEALHDSIADVELRLTISPGFGYYLIKQERRNLSFEVGPSFVYDRLGSGEKSYMALRIGERFDQKIGERARLWQSLELLPQVDDLANFIAKLELGVEADLTEKMSLRVTLQDVYDNEPAPGRDENDIRLVSGVAYKF
jgi:putative salt-induced outer membrane protein YdiY